MLIVSVVLNNFINDSRVLKECTSLKRSGYDVRVIALHGENLFESEELCGVDVTRIRLISKKIFPNYKGLLFQALRYIEFGIKFICIARKADFIHCNDLGPLPISVICKWLTCNRIKIVYDAHEFETEQENDINPQVHRLMVCTESFLIKYVDRMITVSNSIAEEYVKRYKISLPVVVLNSPLFRSMTIPKPDKFREVFCINKETKIFLYQGGLMKGRSIEVLIQAFNNIENRNVVLVIMGYGPLQQYVQIVANSSPNIYFHDAVQPQVLLEYTASADFGISLIENICLSYYYCLPNKLFEYCMAGLPVVLSNLFEQHALNQKYNIGILVDEITSENVSNAINIILNQDYMQYHRNALQMAADLCWENQETKLIEVYRKL